VCTGVTDVSVHGCYSCEGAGGVTGVTMVHRVCKTAMSVLGVPRLNSALRSSSTCLVIRLVAVDTGATVSLVSAARCRRTIARSGPSVARVCSTLCAAGAHSFTIPPSDAASTEISQVFLRLVT